MTTTLVVLFILLFVLPAVWRAIEGSNRKAIEEKTYGRPLTGVEMLRVSRGETSYSETRAIMAAEQGPGKHRDENEEAYYGETLSEEQRSRLQRGEVRIDQLKREVAGTKTYGRPLTDVKQYRQSQGYDMRRAVLEERRYGFALTEQERRRFDADEVSIDEIQDERDERVRFGGLTLSPEERADFKAGLASEEEIKVRAVERNRRLNKETFAQLAEERARSQREARRNAPNFDREVALWASQGEADLRPGLEAIDSASDDRSAKLLREAYEEDAYAWFLRQPETHRAAFCEAYEAHLLREEAAESRGAD